MFTFNSTLAEMKEHGLRINEAEVNDNFQRKILPWEGLEVIFH